MFATWPLPVPFPAGFGWGEVGLLYRAARIGDPSLELEHRQAWKAIAFERLPASAASKAELGSIGAPLDGTAHHLAAIYYGALARRLSAERNPAWNRASLLALALLRQTR